MNVRRLSLIVLLVLAVPGLLLANPATGTIKQVSTSTIYLDSGAGFNVGAATITLDKVAVKITALQPGMAASVTHTLCKSLNKLPCASRIDAVSSPTAPAPSPTPTPTPAPAVSGVVASNSSGALSLADANGRIIFKGNWAKGTSCLIDGAAVGCVYIKVGFAATVTPGNPYIVRIDSKSPLNVK